MSVSLNCFKCKSVKTKQSGATCWPPHPSPFANYICLDALWSELWCEISIQAHSWRISECLSAHTSQVWCGYTIKYVAGEDLREVRTEYSLSVNFRVRWIRVFGVNLLEKVWSLSRKDETKRPRSPLRWARGLNGFWGLGHRRCGRILELTGPSLSGCDLVPGGRAEEWMKRQHSKFSRSKDEKIQANIKKYFKCKGL